MAGIKPTSAGFETVEIAPNFGSLKHIKLDYPTVKGIISLNLSLDKKGKVTGQIALPEGTTGVFKWAENTVDLSPGTNDL